MGSPSFLYIAYLHFVNIIYIFPEADRHISAWQTTSVDLYFNSTFLSGWEELSSHPSFGHPWFASERGYGYVCSKGVNVGDAVTDAVAVVFRDVSVQPFNVKSGTVQPPPGG